MCLVKVVNMNNIATIDIFYLPNSFLASRCALALRPNNDFNLLFFSFNVEFSLNKFCRAVTDVWGNCFFSRSVASSSLRSVVVNLGKSTRKINVLLFRRVYCFELILYSQRQIDNTTRRI